MKIGLDLSALGKTKGYEYALRFAFGGAITVATGLIANKWTHTQSVKKEGIAPTIMERASVCA
jgi:hypothetical protein